ncbi:hypothetical protein [Rhizobium leguminosarum]|uniref:hypothetical protein n=1 Tax=Rhizobium leguminosarum TaxID=384 RepID=UPI001A9167B4|nr:hypothetical protein [Rhizobium leguminosarum]MBY5554170.1 hypothetical protein [Rhizobium leguminosarum]QSW27289.1 hypothetical protein J0664_31180 [Rhizobium leguminosarum]
MAAKNRQARVMRFMPWIPSFQMPVNEYLMEVSGIYPEHQMKEAEEFDRSGAGVAVGIDDGQGGSVC